MIWEPLRAGAAKSQRASLRFPSPVAAEVLMPRD